MKSIQERYLRIVFLILIIIYLLLGFTTYHITKQKQVNTILSLSNQIVDAKGDQISTWIQMLISELGALTKLNSLENDIWEIMESDLKAFARKRQDTYDFLIVSDCQGNYYTTLAGKSPYNIADREYFKQLFDEKKEFVVSDPVISKSTGRMIVVIALPIRNSDNETIGALLGGINVKTISNIVSNIKLKESGYGWIIDSKGFVIAHPNYDYLLKLNVLTSDTAGFKHLQAAGKKMLSSQSGTAFIEDARHIKKMLVYKPISNTNSWTLGVSVPVAKIFKPVYQYLMFIIIGFIIATLLSLLLISLSTKHIISNYINNITTLNKRLTLNERKLKTINRELSRKNKIIHNQNTTLSSTLKQLKETQAQLVQADKMASLGMLSDGISHEINNPLNFIMAGYEGLKAYFDHAQIHNDEIHILLSSIKTGVERASDIVKGLNQFCKTSNKNDEVCEIHHIINNCIFLLHHRTKDKIQFILNYCKDELQVTGNEGQLHQVFMNVLTNSIDAIQTQGTITIVSSETNKKASIKIMDDGSGINQENLTKIMNPFFTTKAPGKGTGLGLSIAYSIIKEHNGTIEITSKENQGTTVEIKLPTV